MTFRVTGRVDTTLTVTLNAALTLMTVKKRATTITRKPSNLIKVC